MSNYITATVRVVKKYEVVRSDGVVVGEFHDERYARTTAENVTQSNRTTAGWNLPAEEPSNV